MIKLILQTQSAVKSLTVDISNISIKEKVKKIRPGTSVINGQAKKKYC